MKSGYLNRRGFLAISSGLIGTARAVALGQGRTATEPSPEVEWHDLQDWGVEGRGWTDQKRYRYYDRLPAKAEKMVRDAVWNLSRDSAGMMARFETDSPEIYVRYQLFRNRLAMSHMPATGVSGVDLYGLDPAGSWRWIAVARPDSTSVQARLAAGLDRGSRKYSLYLPLYNGVDSVEVGVVKGSRFDGIPPRSERPVVYYGTSITHGACASRPGMPHPAILGRRLDLPAINLGFSGNGRMETEVGELLGELGPAVFVIDCLPNMNADAVRERTVPLVRQLKKALPDSPVILVEDRSFTNSWVLGERREHHRRSREELRKAFEQLRADSVPGLFYLEGEHLLGDDSEGATDGSHPSDLGFMRQADAFEPVIRKAVAAR